MRVLKEPKIGVAVKTNKTLRILILLFALNARASDLPPDFEMRFQPLALSTAMSSVIMKPVENLLIYANTKPADAAAIEHYRAQLIREMYEMPPSRNSVHAVELVISSLLNRFTFQKYWGFPEQNLFRTCVEYLKKHGQGRSLAEDVERELQMLKEDTFITIRFQLQKPLEDLLKTIKAKPLELKNFQDNVIDLTPEERTLILKRAAAIEQQLRNSKSTSVCKDRLGDNDNVPSPRD